jgi:hypothetical protein
MHWRGLKSVALVELTRTLMQRMDKQGPNASILRYGLHSTYRVLQSRTEFDALSPSIECKRAFVVPLAFFSERKSMSVRLAAVGDK